MALITRPISINEEEYSQMVIKGSLGWLRDEIADCKPHEREREQRGLS